VLLGPSGCGKTTTLKIINRLVTPTGGRVLVDGQDTSQFDVIELRRKIGYVIQQVGLFPHMTVEQNIGVVPRLLGWPVEKRRQRALDLLAMVGLDPAAYAGRYPRELSGGQAQRIGVARALAADPPILLMDEPFGALDPMTRREMHDEMRRIQEQVRKTILIVTHDMGEAFAMGTRVGVLADGALAALDTPRAIARSEDPRVTGLLAPLFEAWSTLQGDAR